MLQHLLGGFIYIFSNRSKPQVERLKQTPWWSALDLELIDQTELYPSQPQPQGCAPSVNLGTIHQKIILLHREIADFLIGTKFLMGERLRGRSLNSGERAFDTFPLPMDSPEPLAPCRLPRSSPLPLLGSLLKLV